MSVLYTVSSDRYGWRISHAGSSIASCLTLGEAIRQARQAGREHHRRTGAAVRVEMEIPEAKALLLEEHTAAQVEAA